MSAGAEQGAAGEPTSLWHPQARPITVGATALISLFALEYIAVGTAMPTVARALDGLALYALAFGGTIAGSVIGMILGGWWSDRSGPARVVTTGSLVLTAGLVVAGLAPQMEIFILGRALQGIGGGLAQVAIYVVIAQGLPDRLRPMMFSILAAAWVVPGLIGPVLTGLAVDHLHWRAVFLGVAPLVLVALLVLRPALARTHPADDSPFLSGATVGWAVAAALAAGSLYLAGDTITWVEVIIGIPLIALLVTAARALLPSGTLVLRRGMPSVISTRGLLGASFIVAEAYLPLLMQEVHGYGVTESGAVLAVGSVTWALGSLVQGRLSEAVDRYRVLALGTGVVAVGMSVLTAALALGWSGWTILVIWGLTLLGVGLAYPTTSLLTLRLSARAEFGRNSSALQVSEPLTTAVLLAGAGALFTLWHAGSTVLWAFVAVLVIATASAAGSTLTAARARPVSGPPSGQ